MSQLWENVTNAIDTIKETFFAFYDIVKYVLTIIPSPFSEILDVAVIIIVAIVALKIVRG